LKALTVDNDHAKASYPRLFKNLGIRTVPAEDDTEALIYLNSITAKRGSLDLITTDICHFGLGGIGLVEWIRNLADDRLIAGGLRLRQLPIVVISCCASQGNIETIRRIDPTIEVIDKSLLCREDHGPLAKIIDNAVCNYRSSILEELQFVGLSIVWEGK